MLGHKQGSFGDTVSSPNTLCTSYHHLGLFFLAPSTHTTLPVALNLLWWLLVILKECLLMITWSGLLCAYVREPLQDVIMGNVHSHCTAYSPIRGSSSESCYSIVLVDYKVKAAQTSVAGAQKRKHAPDRLHRSAGSQACKTSIQPMSSFRSQLDIQY
jgi:hypothetical protein